MTDTPELLPCPFCGGAPKVRQAVGETWVVCGSCAASTNSITRASVAFDLWNRRAAAPSVQPDREVTFTVDELAQEIRRVDGNHDLGAGALAEALTPFLVEKLIAYADRAALTVQKEEG